MKLKLILLIFSLFFFFSLYLPSSAFAWTCGTDTVTFTYRGETQTYGTIFYNNKCWFDRNLGASRAPQSFNDSLAYGDLFQWGRGADGHQLRNSTITSTLSDSDTPSNSSFITNITSPLDWRSPQNNNLWQGVDGINNPCPSGWRLPTRTEWQGFVSTLSDGPDGDSYIDYDEAYATPLKLQTAGIRSNFDGSVQTYMGMYWSSTIGVGNTNYSSVLKIYDTLARTEDQFRAYGMSVRCIMDNYTPPVPNSAPANPTSLLQIDLARKTDVQNGSTTSNNMRLYASTTDADADTQLSLYFVLVPNMTPFVLPENPTTETACEGSTNYEDCSGHIWSVTSTAFDFSVNPYNDFVNVYNLPDSGYVWWAMACDDAAACSDWVPFDDQTPNFTVDTAPPQISNIKTQATDRTDTMDIKWETDENSSSRVQFGLTPDFDYGSLLTRKDTDPLVQQHTYRVYELASCTTYYYQVISQDSCGNQVSSDPEFFITSGCPGNSEVNAFAGSNEIISFDTGGTASLTNNNETISLQVPQNYFTDIVFQSQTIPAEPAVFQIKKMDKTQFLAVSSTPSNDLSSIGSQIYHLSAKIDYYSSRSDFAKPLTISMQYTPFSVDNFDEDTLWIYRFDDSNWHALDDCTVDKNTKTITCTTTNFSTFVLFGRQPSSESVSSASSSSNSPTAPSCNDSKPIGISDLFQNDITGTTAKLFFTPLSDTNTYYISFSTNPNAEEHGEKVTLLREGVQSHTVYKLKPNTIYYFKVRGQNGCMSGEWSTILKAKTSSGSSGKLFKYYKYGPVNQITAKITKVADDFVSSFNPSSEKTLVPAPIKPTSTPIINSPQPISTKSSSTPQLTFWQKILKIFDKK